jgi:hypothetical protein
MKKYNRIYTPLNALPPLSAHPVMLFIKQPNDEYLVYQTGDRPGVFHPAESEMLSHATVNCRTATMGLCGQAYSVWDGQEWEHREARKPAPTADEIMAELFGPTVVMTGGSLNPLNLGNDDRRMMIIDPMAEIF